MYKCLKVHFFPNFLIAEIIIRVSSGLPDKVWYNIVNDNVNQHFLYLKVLLFSQSHRVIPTVGLGCDKGP